MNQTLLDQLRDMTVVVADTGDFQAIRQFTPRDATTNPSLIAAAAQMPEYQDVVDETLLEARKTLGPGAGQKEVVSLAFDRLAITFGLRILEIIPGRVSTEVDARLSFDTAATISKARAIMAQYQAAGIGPSRVLIKIASTWEGIRAAERLEQEGIHCNLTLLFGFAQAVACAEAGVTLISPFVGRILDWYKANTGRENFPGPEDPGVISVSKIYNYFKTYGYKTEVMGASFRNIDEIIELAGCDLLTISPALMEQLRNLEGPLTRKLNPQAPGDTQEKIHVDLPLFTSMMAEDRMASEKLDEGIRGFSRAIEALEVQLAHRLAALEGKAAFTHAVHEIFLLNDLDGDGCITREEWLGSDAVFDALDTDQDGRLAPDDVRGGLGAALSVRR